MSRVAPHITLDAVQEEQLQTWMKAPSTPQSLALRSRIVLAAAGGQSNQQIASNLSLPQITVSKWRRRFASHGLEGLQDRKSTRLNSSHVRISYAVFCLKKKKQ